MCDVGVTARQCSRDIIRLNGCDSSVLASFSLAALAGLISFLSPCVFPLVPSYLAYIGGGSSAPRAVRIRNSLLFILGFSLCFVALGASASWIGSILLAWRFELIIIGGVIVIIFGLSMLGLFRIPFLMRQLQIRTDDRPGTPGGAVLLGFAFAIGWTPCIGPILAGVLTMASVSDTLAQGILLLSTYALGLGVPFLLAALMLDRFIAASGRIKKHLGTLEKVGGAMLVLMGLLMLTGYYTVLNGFLLRITPDWMLL